MKKRKAHGLRALAQGGRVEAGEPVIVGDGGQEELFVPDSAPQYQGRYRRMREYADSGKQMDMAPQPAIPRSEEEWEGMYNTPIPADRAQDYEKWKWDQSRQRGRDITRDQSGYDIQGYFMSRGRDASNGHGPDTFKKPSHEGFSADSQYSGLDGYEGGHWGHNDKTGLDTYTPSDTNWEMNSRRSMDRYANLPGEKPTEIIEDVGGKMMNTNIPGYGLRALARGGYVEQGEPVIVGDGGQPELFVPDQSGYVYPELPYPQRREEDLWDKTMGALGPSDAYAFYAGPESKTADREKLAQAQQLTAAGEQPNSVRQQTGWFQGPDQKWRYEIPDNPEAFVQERLPQAGQSAKLSDVYKDESLYQAYPDMKDYKVTGSDMLGASYTPGGRNIYMGKEYTDVDNGTQDKFKLLAHEVQHAVQDKEYTSPGSDPSRDPNYFTRPGEVEARDVANRVGLGPQERLNRAPVQLASAPAAPQDGVGLAPLQAAQPAQQTPPAPKNAQQAQVAQAVLDTVQGGTPRETIEAIMKITGMRGSIQPGENGGIVIADERGRPMHKFGGLQDVIAYAYQHVGDNAGLPDHYLSLAQKEARRKDQVNLNTKALDYVAQMENRNYTRQANSEQIDRQAQRTMDTENRRITATYLQQLDRAKKSWAEGNKYNTDANGNVPAFPQDQFDQEFEGATGISVGALRRQNMQGGRPQGGPGLGQMPPQGMPQPQPMPAPAPAPAPQPGGGNKVQELVGKPAPQAAPTAAQGVDITPQSLREAVAAGKMPREQAAEMARQRGWIRTTAPQAAPSAPARQDGQQEAPQVGLGQPDQMQPQGPTAGEQASQAVSSVVNPQRGNEPSADWQQVGALPEKLEAQYPGIVGYLTAISQAQRLPFNVVLGVLTKGGEGAAKLWQGFQRARQTGSAY